MVTEFTQVNSLPGTQHQMVITNGNANGTPYQRRLYMGWHIVWPFIGMTIIGLVFRDKMIEGGLEIETNRGVSIFIEGKSGRSMLNKYVQYPLCR